MKSVVEQKVDAVAARIFRQRLADALSAGFFYGALAGLAIFGVGLSFSPPLWIGALWAAPVLLGVFAGLVFGLTRRKNRREAAGKIDKFYRLKERTLTATELRETGAATGIERLQIADAERFAEGVDPAAAAPFRRPRFLGRSIFISLVFITSAILSRGEGQNPASATAEPRPESLALADEVQDGLLTPITELVRENPEEVPLQALQERLDRIAERLRENASNPTESLAALSEMDTVLDKARGEYDSEAAARSMSELGGALSEIKPQNGEFSKADLEKMTPEERKRTAARLGAAAEEMKNQKQGEWAEAAERLAEAIRNSDGDSFAENARRLDDLHGRQRSRQNIGRELSGKSAFLALCKSNFSESLGREKNGGEGTGPGQAGKMSGRGESTERKTGQESASERARQVERAAGVWGEGPSEIETAESEGSETAGEKAARPYREIYREYRKVSESVLETEPIPLGRRRVIQRYFEAIKPEEKEEEK